MSHAEETADLLGTSATAAAPRLPKPPGALLTRKELARYITDELGRPMSFSTLTKLCALGEGPPVHEWWGRFPLYTREGGKMWSDARARKTRPAATPQMRDAQADE